MVSFMRNCCRYRYQKPFARGARLSLRPLASVSLETVVDRSLALCAGSCPWCEEIRITLSPYPPDTARTVEW